MSLFPFISVDETTIESINTELPLLKEFAIDFKTGNPVIENKSFKLIEGKEALKIWIYKALKIDRFQYEIYSWNFGSEISDLMGKGYTQALTQSEIKRYIEEALYINPYVKEVQILETSFKDNTLSVKLSVDSVYGNMEVSF